MGAITYLGVILTIQLVAAVVYGVILISDLKAIADRIKKD